MCMHVLLSLCACFKRATKRIFLSCPAFPPILYSIFFQWKFQQETKNFFLQPFLRPLVKDKQRRSTNINQKIAFVALYLLLWIGTRKKLNFKFVFFFRFLHDYQYVVMQSSSTSHIHFFFVMGIKFLEGLPIYKIIEFLFDE